MSTALHDDHRHAQRPLPIRAHPLVLAVVLFLASELMFFAALFAAYFDLRVNRAVWPPPDVHLRPVESTVGTLLLFLSSVAMVLVGRAMDNGKDRAARSWVIVAIVCALSFVVLAIHGYTENAFTIASHAYGSIFYAMTGFHLLHVLAGAGLLIALALGISSRALRANARAGAEAMTYYWHFVFIVWLGIWGTIYFIR